MQQFLGLDAGIAIEAAQVAPVGDGDSQIIEPPVTAVNEQVVKGIIRVSGAGFRRKFLPDNLCVIS
jgi:hypothetical protein